MSIWSLRLPMTREEEDNLTARTVLPLPFEGMPDLSTIGGAGDFRKLLLTLHPDAPPETLNRKQEKSWRFFCEMHEEDIIIVPLQHRKQVAIAEITGRYQHHVDAKGHDVHEIPVKWHPKRIPMFSFRKYPEIIDAQGELLSEVSDQQARIIVRDRLPHSYNRFAGFKWIVVIFFGWQAIQFAIRMYNQTMFPGQ